MFVGTRTVLTSVVDTKAIQVDGAGIVISFQRMTGARGCGRYLGYRRRNEPGLHELCRQYKSTCSKDQ